MESWGLGREAAGPRVAGPAQARQQLLPWLQSRPQAWAPQVGTRVHPTHRASAGRAGFPPIQGLEASEPAQQSLVGVLETAMKLASQDEGPEDEEDEALRKVRG